MKASQSVLDSVSEIKKVSTTGDMRRIVGNAMLGLLRKEISANDGIALSKMLASVTGDLYNEVRIAKAKVEMGQTAADMGKISQLGRLEIDSAPDAT